MRKKTAGRTQQMKRRSDCPHVGTRKNLQTSPVQVRLRAMLHPLMLIDLVFLDETGQPWTPMQVVPSLNVWGNDGKIISIDIYVAIFFWDHLQVTLW